MKPVVRYLDETEDISCPYGDVRRVVTGGEYPGANVHVVSVTRGGEHYHEGYDEVYYVLSGEGRMRLDGKRHTLRPGTVVAIPAGVSHSLDADDGQVLTFVIFGTPGMSVDDSRFLPRPPLFASRSFPPEDDHQRAECGHKKGTRLGNDARDLDQACAETDFVDPASGRRLSENA